jgi:hypothetical protein
VNKKVLIIVLIAAVVALLVVLTRRGQPPATESPPITNSFETIIAKPTPQKQNVSYTDSNSFSQPLPPGSNMQERLEKLAQQRGVPLDVLSNQLLEQMSNAFSSELNRALDFYGKTVDESGKPLNGVTASISCLIYPEKQFRTNISTDANGLFELHGINGQALRVTLKKDGFEEIPETNDNHFFAYYGVGKGFQPDAANPVIFPLRKNTSNQK